MNRNTENNFSMLPQADISRSTFEIKSQHKTTINAGDLVPIYIDEVLPGDTHDIDMAWVARMTTPIHPVMDNAFLDVYFFFVPMRLIWPKWAEFNGENKTEPWTQPVEYQIPQITAPAGGWNKGTIADYFGIPIGVSNLSITALPFRAYALIWNEWFRDQNVQTQAYINLGDNTVSGTNGNDQVLDAQLGGMPLPVNKYHDYFTSCLPAPQKGPSVALPLGKNAPVKTSDESIPLSVMQNHVMRFKGLNNENITAKWAMHVEPRADGSGTLRANDVNTISPQGGFQLQPNNLWADLSLATAATINQLRTAFQIQKLFERDARGGTRYTEILKSHFGVTSPDARLQRPEYLGGKRTPIVVDQVLQTSSTDTVSPQGNTAAYSLTGERENCCLKSFTEHGYIIGLACIRTEHTYQQGIERFWSRKKRFDFYWPALANIGEQAVLNKEIYATGNQQQDEQIFGYQEAWAEYRYKPSRTSGAFRSTYAQPLDMWHYADHFAARPILSSEFMVETKKNIDRTISVSSELEDQFIIDMYFKNRATRPLPVYSIPGLIDHN